MLIFHPRKKQELLPSTLRLVVFLFYFLLLDICFASTPYQSSLDFLKPNSLTASWRLLRGGGTSSSANRSRVSSSDVTATVVPPPLQYNESAIDAGSWPTKDLVDMLKTNVEQGLSKKQVEARLAQFGVNSLRPPPKATLLELIAEQFEDRLVQILLSVAVVSGLFSVLEHTSDKSFLQSFVEPIVILAILVLNAAVGVWQSQSASHSLNALQKMQPSLCTSLREGEWMVGLPASELVPGDIVKLRVGDKIPADARLLELQSSTLQVDETSLTGESVTVSKLPGFSGQSLPGAPIQSQLGMLFSGTMVTRGNALAVVVQTGMATQFGKIQQGVVAAQKEIPKTPLATKLDELGNTLTLVIGVICIAVWLVSIPKMNDPSFASVWEGAIYYAKVAVALGVAAIPEGLPAVVTLCLSLGTRRMAQRNVIVRKLPSVETLGCTSVICTDKTGTLTTNEMTAVSLVVMEKGCGPVEHTIEGTSYSPLGNVQGVEPNEEVKQYPKGAIADVAAVSALCNDATIIGKDPDFANPKQAVSLSYRLANHGNNKRGAVGIEKVYERTGEPTEAALCILAEKLGGMSHYSERVHPSPGDPRPSYVPPSVLASANVDCWRERYPRQATMEFHRERKSMSVLADFSKRTQKSYGKTARKRNRLLVKGAPNLLLERCTHVKYRDGTVVKLTGSLKRSIQAKITELATRPLRCLALAVKETDCLVRSLARFNGTRESTASHPILKDSSKYKDIESGLTLVGIVGIKDPARPEVADSILKCAKAGIRVMMITGDARDTAIAIAKDVNIFDSNKTNTELKAFEGREFFLKAESEQLEILKTDNVVFCRAEPADKQKLVKMLQRLGEIPAMTGDGVNDAPALQQAAIGVAMGTGTEVSKEASDMVLSDDNFSTIVAAVEEGRTIYSNMQAFICFLISCNIGEICAIFLATLAGFPEPLTAMHLLWVNLVTDGPPATALGFNPPQPNMMESPPRPSNEPIMTKWLLVRYVITGVYVGIATIAVFVQHYLCQGMTLSELSNWSQCGSVWSPEGGAQLCNELFRESGRMLPQTLALTTLICMEMLKALSAVSVDNSLLSLSPMKNKWLLLGVSGPFLLHLLVLYSARLGFSGWGESVGIVSYHTGKP